MVVKLLRLRSHRFRSNDNTYTNDTRTHSHSHSCVDLYSFFSFFLLLLLFRCWYGSLNSTFHKPWINDLKSLYSWFVIKAVRNYFYRRYRRCRRRRRCHHHWTEWKRTVIWRLHIDRFNSFNVCEASKYYNEYTYTVFFFFYAIELGLFVQFQWIEYYWIQILFERPMCTNIIECGWACSRGLWFGATAAAFSQSLRIIWCCATMEAMVLYRFMWFAPFLKIHHRYRGIDLYRIQMRSNTPSSLHRNNRNVIAKQTHRLYLA